MEATQLLNKYSQKHGFGDWNTVIQNCHITTIAKIAQEAAIEAMCDTISTETVKYTLHKEITPQDNKTAKSIYIASSWKNQHAVEMLTTLLRQLGFVVLSWIENNYGETHNHVTKKFDFETWVNTNEIHNILHQ